MKLAVLLAALSLTTSSETPAEREHANCVRAQVSAPSAGKFALSVSCHAPSHGDTLGFTLSRGSGGAGDRPGIRGFSRHLRLTGPGAVRPRGTCRRGTYGEVGCRFPANGRITAMGSIRVRPGTECRRPITLTTTVTTCDPNRDGACPASLVTRALWSSLPKGC